MTTTSRPPPVTTTATASSLCVQKLRREKRRHATVIPDPLALLNLAVQMDERESEAYLRVPLEGGRLYSDDFEEVVHLLKAAGSAPSSAARAKSARRAIYQNRPRALTPTVLSGLLLRDAGVRGGPTAAHHSNSTTTNNNTTNNNTNLVSHARILRSQALQRWKRKRYHQRWRCYTIVSLTMALGFLYSYQGIARLSLIISELGFMGNSDNKNTNSEALRPPLLFSCRDLPVPRERELCRSGDARVWTAIRNKPLLLSNLLQLLGEGTTTSNNDGTTGSSAPSLSSFAAIHDDYKNGNALYAMHTKVTEGVRKHVKSTSTSTSTSTNNILHSHTKPSSATAAVAGIRWYGDSRLAQLIRPHVGPRRVRILDVGCGIGALLYALSPHLRNYTCLTTSPAAITIGRTLMQRHGLHEHHSSIQFVQMGLERYLKEYPHDDEYDVIVGIDSLSYEMMVSSSPPSSPSSPPSPLNDRHQQANNGLALLKDLLSRLSMNGKFIMVDDVVRTHQYYQRNERILWTHQNWTQWFLQESMQISQQRDLGLEFVLPELEVSSSRSSSTFRRLTSVLQVLERLTLHSSPVWHCAMELFGQVVRHQQQDAERAQAHARGSYMYVMYIGTKVSAQELIQDKQQQCMNTNHVQQQKRQQQQMHQCIPNDYYSMRQPQQLQQNHQWVPQQSQCNHRY